MTRIRSLFNAKPLTAALTGVILTGCVAAGGQQAEMTPTAAPAAESEPAVGPYDEAIAHFQKLLNEGRTEADVVLGLSRNLRWAGRVNEAADLLSLHTPDLRADAAFWSEFGKARIAQGRIPGGVDMLKRAVDKNSNDWRLYSALGIGHDYLGEYGQAREAYLKALELCPDDPAVMNNMGISQALSGDLDRAIITLDAATQYGRHSDKIKANMKLFSDARDMCATCGANYLREAGGTVLAAGLRATDTASACEPEEEFVAERNVMEEQLSVSEQPSINIKVHFEFDSAILRPEAERVLDDLAATLTSDALKGYRFELAGHTDAVGSDAYNLELSQARARAVLDYLVIHHEIDASRLDTTGYGESQLLDPSDPEGEINRRVQVTRLEKM